MVSTGATLVGVVGSAGSEPPPKTAASGPTKGVTAMAAAATRGVGPALAYAKSLTKGEEDQLVANERILRGTLENAGATVDVIGDLKTPGCVRGVRIRIRPRRARGGDVHGG